MPTRCLSPAGTSRGACDAGAARPHGGAWRAALAGVRLGLAAAALVVGLAWQSGRARAETRAADVAEAIGEAPVGFGRGTTGGCTERGCVCEVTTLADDRRSPPPGSLRQCAEARDAKWIIFSARGTIRLERPLAIASNKIIDGRKQKPNDEAVVIAGPAHFLFLIEDTRNIIVTDLYFRNDQMAAGQSGALPRCMNQETPEETRRCGLPIQIRGAVKNVWINHSDFNHCGSKCIIVWTEPLRGEVPDGRAAGADLVTISNNVFRNSFYAVLIGASAKLPENRLPEQTRVTLYGNVFFNVFRRSPRAASFTKVHAFNNVLKYWGTRGASCEGKYFSWGASSVGEAQLLLENNVMIARPEPDACKLGDQVGDKDPKEGFHRGTGKVRARGNLLENGATITENEPDEVFDPSDRSRGDLAYSYTLRSTAGLEQAVEQTAGVRGFVKYRYGD